jgi:hypothetical protein
VLGLLREYRLNLSQHKSLRVLRFLAREFPTDQARALQPINALLSTIPSSSQLDVMLIYEGFEFSLNYARSPPGHEGNIGESNAKICCGCGQCIRNLDRLKMLGEAYWNRRFRLILCVEDQAKETTEYTGKALNLQVGAHRDGELHLLLSGSLITPIAPCFASGYSY